MRWFALPFSKARPTDVSAMHTRRSSFDCEPVSLGAGSTVAGAGLLSYRLAPEHVLELSFVANQEATFDLRPTLPLVFRGIARDVV
jgi:hypothetical protein